MKERKRLTDIAESFSIRPLVCIEKTDGVSWSKKSTSSRNYDFRRNFPGQLE